MVYTSAGLLYNTKNLFIGISKCFEVVAQRHEGGHQSGLKCHPGDIGREGEDTGTQSSAE